MVLAKSIHAIGLVAILSLPVSVASLWAQGECVPQKREIRVVQKSYGETAQIVPWLSKTDDISKSALYHPGDCIYLISSDDQVNGYLFSTRAKGRFDYFDYSIIFSDDFKVMKVVVTVYRSTHGAAISQKKWLSQFEGYQGGRLELGKDIDAVSGGTLSASSITNDIQRCHLLISTLGFE